MKIADTISVNPSKTALGHSETRAAGLFRGNVLTQENKAHKIDLMSLAFPSTASGMEGIKKYSLPLRALFATVLIVSGLTILQTPMGFHGAAIGIMEIIFGGFLALGMLTRPVMFAAGIYFAIASALSIRSGQPDLNSLTLMFGSFVFAALGSSKYSVDFILRKGIKRTILKNRRKKGRERMGYKAFHYVK